MAGPRRLLYGGPRDLLLGVRAVDAAGTITKAGGRVVKNVTGYDLNKLYLGSLGTLAVLVEASFKLVPLPETEATALAVCQELSQALAVADAWNNLPAQPAAVCALTLAEIPRLAEQMAPGVQGVAVAARFPGPAAAIDRAVEDARHAARKAGTEHVERLDGDAHATFWDDATDCPATMNLPPNTALIKVSVLPSEVGNTLQTTLSVTREHGLRAAWMADTGVGVVYLRVQPAIPATAPADGAEDVSTVEALRTGLVALQSMLAQRWRNAVVLGCSPELKADLPLWGAEPPGIEVMRIIKHRFDPADTLNPGRFVAGI
jgi:glycolate oxidase FAD binding subunit